jgi:peptide/nickel transport system permease protein
MPNTPFRRFVRQPAALMAAVLLAALCLVALPGPMLAPDPTPDGNRQLPAVALQGPGFRTAALRIRKNQPMPPTHWGTAWLQGRPDDHEWVPVSEYRLRGDTLEAVEWRANGAGKLRYWHLADVVYPLVSDRAIHPIAEDFYAIETIDYGTLTVSSAALRQRFTDHHVAALHFPLGSDNLGRCLLSRLLLGTRLSLAIGATAVLVSLGIGVLLGLLAGYFGGATDRAVQFAANVLWAMPTLLMVFAIALAFGRGASVLFLAVGLTLWVEVARLVRGQVLSLRRAGYVEAAGAMGFSPPRILLRHILPNVLGPVLIVAASNFATAILIEAGLGYLGFGLPAPAPSLGALLSENRGFLTTDKAYLAVLPGAVVMVLVLLFNLLGNGLRDALDVRD